MTTIPVPQDAPELWDTVIVAGVPAPGLAQISDAAREFKIDIKDGPGIDGAESTYRGTKLSELKLEIKLWEPEHWTQLPRFLKALKFDPAKGSGHAVDISHPSLLTFDPPIRSCVASYVGSPKRVRDGDTLYEIKIDLVEYRPPKKKNVTKTPAGSDGSTQGKGGTGGKDGIPGLKVPDARGCRPCHRFHPCPACCHQSPRES